MANDTAATALPVRKLRRFTRAARRAASHRSFWSSAVLRLAPQRHPFATGVEAGDQAHANRGRASRCRFSSSCPQGPSPAKCFPSAETRLALQSSQPRRAEARARYERPENMTVRNQSKHFSCRCYHFAGMLLQTDAGARDAIEQGASRMRQDERLARDRGSHLARGWSKVSAALSRTLRRAAHPGGMPPVPVSQPVVPPA